MKLGVVRHVRCNEPTPYKTLVWVPGDWSLDDFVGAVNKASCAYLEFARTYSAEDKADRPGHMPPYEKYPDKRVSEVQEIHSAAKRQYEEWSAERAQARRSFSEYLEDEGLIGFWEHEPEFTDEVDWGHHHGVSIDYSATETVDYPGVEPREPHPFS